MSRDESGPRRDAPPDPEPTDAGLPISELAGFDHPASTSFLIRLRGRLNRRVSGTHVVAFAWHAPAVVLIEFLKLVVGLLAPPDRSKGDPR